MMIERTTRKFVPTPPDSKYYWHLMADSFNLKQFLDGAILLTQIRSFNEKEGDLPAPSRAQLRGLMPHQTQQIADEYNQIRSLSFASCWHMSNGDPTEVAWKSFGGFHKGLAIKITQDSLLRSVKNNTISDNGPVFFSKVKYIDHEINSIDISNTIYVAYCVGNEYNGEEEARILLYLKNEKDTFGLPRAANRVDILLEADASKLIEEIVVGHDCDIDERANISAMLEKCNFDQTKLRFENAP